MTSVAALIVTSNSQAWIRSTLESVRTQRRQPDAIVIVDDGSTDDTRAIIDDVLGGTAHVQRATSKAQDRTTRIAHNFLQGIRACAAEGADVVVLGDHDDLWHPARVGHQATQLANDPDALMVAGDGRIVDEHGRATSRTLRDTFPVPADWDDQPIGDQIAYAIRHSIATGGASALKPAAFAEGTIPRGWLHDRWWSLVATVRGGMRIDPAPVIDYRVSATQEVGLATGQQAKNTAERLQEAAKTAPQTLKKARALHDALRDRAITEEARRALSWPNLLKSLA